MKMSVVILAGGQATRMGNLSVDCPKSLIEFNNVPFLQYLISWFIWQNCSDIIISTGHLSRSIENLFGDDFWKSKGVRIVKDPTPLGTGGAIIYAAKQAHNSEILICNGDTVVELDSSFCLSQHLRLSTPITSLVTRKEGVPNQGCLLIEQERIIEFSEGQGPKALERRDGKYRASSTGTYLAKQSFLIENCPNGPFSLEQKLLPRLVAEKLVGAIDNGESFFHDYGTPERYAYLINNSDILHRIYGQPLRT